MDIDKKINKYLNEGIKELFSFGKDMVKFKKPLKLIEKMNKKVDSKKMTTSDFLKGTKEVISLIKKDIESVKDNQEIYDFMKFTLRTNEKFYEKMSKLSDKEFYDVIMDVGEEIANEG